MLEFSTWGWCDLGFDSFVLAVMIEFLEDFIHEVIFIHLFVFVEFDEIVSQLASSIFLLVGDEKLG